ELHEQGKIELKDGLELFTYNKSGIDFRDEQFLSSFLKLTDHTLWHYISVWCNHHDSILYKLCQDVLSRKLYKAFPIENYEGNFDMMRKVIEIEKEEQIDAKYIISTDTPSTSYYKDSYIMQKDKETEESSEKEASEHIILFDQNGTGYELSHKSDIVSSIRNKKLNIKRAYSPLKFKERLLGGK